MPARTRKSRKKKQRARRLKPGELVAQVGGVIFWVLAAAALAGLIGVVIYAQTTAGH